MLEGFRPRMKVSSEGVPAVTVKAAKVRPGESKR
jgi:hypothetical protein